MARFLRTAIARPYFLEAGGLAALPARTPLRIAERMAGLRASTKAATAPTPSATSGRSLAIEITRSPGDSGAAAPLDAYGTTLRVASQAATTATTAKTAATTAAAPAGVSHSAASA